MAMLKNTAHEVFVRALIKNGGNQTKAYMEAYPNASYDSAKSLAVPLAARIKVRNRLRCLLKDKGLGLNECIDNLKELTKAERPAYYKDGVPVMQADNRARHNAVKLALKINLMLGEDMEVDGDSLIDAKGKVSETDGHIT